MSKIVTWGHWLVAAVLATKGMGLLYEMVAYFPRAWRHPHTLTYPTDYLTVALCLLYLACGWGILKWRKWAYIFTVTLSLLEIALFVAIVAMDWSATLVTSIILWTALNCAVVTWLILPMVRTTYQQRQATA